MKKTETVESNVVITPPNFGVLEVLVKGTAPLVIERFSKKAEIMEKMQQGAQANSLIQTAAERLNDISVQPTDQPPDG